MGLKHNIALWSAITFTAFTSGLTIADRWRPQEHKVEPVISCMGNIIGDEKKEYVFLKGQGIYYVQDKGSKKPICILRGQGLKDICSMELDDFDGNGLDDLTLHFDDGNSSAILTYANFGEEGFFYDPNGFNYEPYGHISRSIYRVVQE